MALFTGSQVKVTISIVNNKTDKDMVILHENTNYYESNNDNTYFWGYVEDDLHSIITDDSNEYIFKMFRQDAPISLRTAITILEKVKVQSSSECIKNPTIFWDLSMEEARQCWGEAFEVLFGKFKQYVEIFVNDADLGNLHKQVFTHNLPGCLFTNETRKQVLRFRECINHGMPVVTLKVKLSKEQDVPTIISIPLNDIKGYNHRFDKKYVKEFLLDIIRVNFGGITTKPVSCMCELNIWGYKDNKPLYEFTHEGMADIISEYIRDISNKIYTVQKEDDDDYKNESWYKAISKMNRD